MKAPSAERLHFDIDNYLNRIVPRSRVNRLPQPIAHFLGYRADQQSKVGNLVVAFWALVGAFAAIAALEGLYMTDFIKSRGAPIIIGSFGASAILEFNAIESPLSQPRNTLMGNLFSSIIGVGITKLFALNSDFSSIQWLAGALAVGVASAAMTLTNTIHPPAGATALLAAVEPSIVRLGWFYIGLVVLSSVVTLAIACLLNNIQRRFPVYWWTGADLQRQRYGRGHDEEEKKDGQDEEQREDGHKSEFTEALVIGADGICLPAGLIIDETELSLLRSIEGRLKRRTMSSAYTASTKESYGSSHTSHDAL